MKVYSRFLLLRLAVSKNRQYFLMLQTLKLNYKNLKNEEIKVGVNFTNISRTAFSNESFMRNRLTTTTTILGSLGWSLYSGLTALFFGTRKVTEKLLLKCCWNWLLAALNNCWTYIDWKFLQNKWLFPFWSEFHWFCC